MVDQVEKVARAIFDENFHPDDRQAAANEKWVEWPECRELALKQARAAIAAYNPNERLSRIATLFDAIQHGDEAHRAWLKEAIDKHFAGEAVPAPKGKGNSERLREALEASRSKLRHSPGCQSHWSGIDHCDCEAKQTLAKIDAALSHKE